jgi:hypothetical protein
MSSLLCCSSGPRRRRQRSDPPPTQAVLPPPPPTAAAILSPAQLRSFAADGFLQLPGLVPSSLVGAALRAVADAERQAGSEIQLDGAGGHDGKRVPRGLEQDARILALLLESPASSVAQELLGHGQVLTPMHSQVAIRRPDPSLPATLPALTSPTEWHIDGLGEQIRGEQMLCSPFNLLVGVALSDVLAPNCGNFSVFPGSHHTILPMVQAGLDGGGAALHALLTYSHPEKPALSPGGTQILARKGDIVLAHQKLGHCGGPNNSCHCDDGPAKNSTRIMVYFRLVHVRHAELRRCESIENGPLPQFPYENNRCAKIDAEKTQRRLWSKGEWLCLRRGGMDNAASPVRDLWAVRETAFWRCPFLTGPCKQPTVCQERVRLDTNTRKLNRKGFFLFRSASSRSALCLRSRELATGAARVAMIMLISTRNR